MAANREAFDEAITNMAVKATPFHKDYVYYLHMLAQCKVVFSESLPAAAGVSFDKDHYTLHLNPTEVIGVTKDKKGNPSEVLGYTTKMPLEQRIGILKHEMLHITLGHLIRVEDRDFKKFNIASDCALDQYITRDHLPDYAIYPDNNFPSKERVRWGETSETYYNLIDDDEMEKKFGKDDPEVGISTGNSGEGADKEGAGNGESGYRVGGVGDHSLWKSSQGDTELQKEITKNMVEKAAEQTMKSRGNLPSNYSSILENLTTRREVDWKRVLRQIVGNKKANTRKTLMRRDRRMPLANWIKGKTKDRVFELGVVSDVSGSVGDKALYDLWGEIINICALFNTPVKLVQIDTVPKEPEELTKRSKVVERKASGGTFLSPALDKFKEHKIHFDALVVTTDGYIDRSDITKFEDLKKPIIWLIEPGGHIMNEMNNGKMRAIKLTNEK